MLTLPGFTPRDCHGPVLQYRHWMPIPASRRCHSQRKILLGLIYILLTNSHRVHSSLVLHIPLFSLFTFPLVRFDNQLNEGEVFTEAVCLLPTADFRGGSCVVTWGLTTRLLCWRLVLSPGTKFWKNKVRTWLDTNNLLRKGKQAITCPNSFFYQKCGSSKNIWSPQEVSIASLYQPEMTIQQDSGSPQSPSPLKTSTKSWVSQAHFLGFQFY